MDGFRERVWQGFHERIPHNRALGLQLLELEPGGVVARLPWNAQLVGNPDESILHGGAITSLLDATCGIAVRMRLEQRTPIATLDLRIDYLKPAPASQDVIARCVCFRVTRNVAFVRGTAAAAPHPDDLIASATGSFMIGTKQGSGRQPWDKPA